MSDQECLQEWMCEYQAGRSEAFERLYRFLKTPLQQFLYSKTFNSARTDDLFQETFLQLHRSRHTYIPGKPVLPWAFGIARHVYLMDRRKKYRLKNRETSQDPDSLSIPIPAGLGDWLNREMLQQAIREVSADRRESLLLHHVWGFSFREIASLLGVRTGTARVRAHRGLKDLKKELERLESGEETKH